MGFMMRGFPSRSEFPKPLKDARWSLVSAVGRGNALNLTKLAIKFTPVSGEVIQDYDMSVFTHL